MQHRLVDAATAETQADVLRLNAHLREITASAPGVLEALKAASAAVTRSNKDALVEIQGANQGLAAFLSKRHVELMEELVRRDERLQTLANEREASSRAALAQLASRVRMLAGVVIASLMLNLVGLAVLLGR
jgi:hypothetical protein